MSNGSIDLDKVFCLTSKKYGIDKNLLKAIAIVESSLDPMSYHYEKLFWQNYKDKFPELADRDPKEVSSSYGLMQVSYVVAWSLGFRGPGVDLFNPVYNVEIGAKILTKIRESLIPQAFWRCWPIEVMLARYKGGFTDNPSESGKLANWDYVLLVKREYIKLWMTEKNCE